MSKDDYSAFHALDPFFSVVMEVKWTPCAGPLEPVA